MNKALDNNLALYTFIILVGMVISICIYPPQLVFAKKISDYTVHIMIVLLVSGMFFLLLEKNKLMFASFAYCGILCLFLKGNVNQGLKLAVSSGTPTITIGHFNAASVAEDYSILIDAITDTDADVVSINELTPDWEYVLTKELSRIYPHQAKMVRIDPFGLGILSKKPIERIDTIEFYDNQHPHLMVEVPISLMKDVQIINSYFLPPLTRKEYGDYRVELTKMGQKISDMRGPTIVAGDFNLSDWSAELREFKFQSGLISSRRDVSPKTTTGLKTWMNFPIDHILFNNALECSSFQTVNDSIGNHLGIVGTYQLRAQQIR